ncbi:MAG: Adaptive-response sensory-kinase SasA [Thermoanaerobaculia bacterium]|nr:Adaptive-response sensory-kinase SasA [Thermoanaerobaculia bacterium]
MQGSRESFLSELALAMVEGRDLSATLQESVDRLGELLSVDRVALLLVPPGGATRQKGLLVRAIHVAEGIPPIPGGLLPIDGPGLANLEAWPELFATSDVSVERLLEPYQTTLSGLGTRSLVAARITVDGRMRGFLSLSTVRMRRDWEASELEFVRAAVRLLAAAIKQLELLSDLARRNRISETIARVTRLLNLRLSAPDVLSYFVEEVSAAFPRSQGCVAYISGTTPDFLRVAAAYGSGRATQAAAETGQIPAASLQCAGEAYLSGRPVRLSTAGLDELMAGKGLEERAAVLSAVPGVDVRSLLAVPIRVAEKRLGVIELLSAQPEAFSEEDSATLVVLAEQAAIALRNAHLIEELTRSNRLKDDFLANLSHEVRTPLTGIVGWAEVLRESHGSDPSVESALKAILGQAETLNRILGELIDLSRIENFGLELRRERVVLSDVIRTALDAVRPMAEKRGVQIETEVPPALPSLEADPARLEQVLWNLLSNAVKFSGPGEPVALRARIDAEGRMVIEVEDKGFGIDPSFLPFVFDRFRREEAAVNRRHGGLGVGLSIARAIVAAHGGTIDAASPGRGRGSRFRVTFHPGRVFSAGQEKEYREEGPTVSSGGSREERPGSRGREHGEDP